jgi:hypothetical protein
VLGLILVLAGGQPAVPFRAVAEIARRAFVAHDFRTLLEGSPGVLLHLPGDMGAPRLSSGVAGATLRAFLGRSREVGVVIDEAREVEEQFGYVQLHRRFRPPGVSEDEKQQILVSFRQVNGAWRVVEVLVLE